MNTHFLSRSTADKRSKKTHRDLSSQRDLVYPVSVCALALLSSALLPTSTHAQASASNSVLASDGISIDASVTAHGRQVLMSIMQKLDLEDRENIISVDLNNRVYTNRPELLQNLHFAPMEKDNSYVSSNGEVIAIPRLTNRPNAAGNVMPLTGDTSSPLVVTPGPNSGGTGPFRRVYSRATTTTGYSWESAYVLLQNPSGIKIAATTPADIAYVYEGGWGANGGAVDAGFQYSTANISNSSGNWAAVVQRESSSGAQLWGYTPSRFYSYEEDNLKFYVPSDNMVAIAWTATAIAEGSRNEITMAFAEAAGYGWKANGAGCILKRMTSIGQTPPENLNDGSYIKGTEWYNCLIGKSQTSNHSWTATDVGGYQNYPANSSKVSVNYVSPSQETDTINLGL